MGANQSLQKLNYEDVQYACSSNEYVIISTLPATQQDCLIKKTIMCNNEEEILNNLCLLYTSDAADDSLV